MQYIIHNIKGYMEYIHYKSTGVNVLIDPFTPKTKFRLIQIKGWYSPL